MANLPNPAWLPYLRLILGFTFGFCLLTVLGWLAHEIALGHVEATTSYGLGEITGCLQTLAGAFSGWGFGQAIMMGKKSETSKDGE
jgi:hypothetical protein